LKFLFFDEKGDLVHFYAPFLPRDAMHSADCDVARCLSVCLSVCLSHADIVSKWLNISTNFFSPRSTSHTILFSCRTIWQQSVWNLQTGRWMHAI